MAPVPVVQQDLLWWAVLSPRLQSVPCVCVCVCVCVRVCVCGVCVRGVCVWMGERKGKGVGRGFTVYTFAITDTDQPRSCGAWE